MTQIQKVDGAARQIAAPIKSVGDLVESGDFRAQIERALPATMKADRYLRVVATLLRRTPALAKCSVQSFASCLLDCAQLGLEPGGALGRAYLVPYKDVCTLVVGYRGLIELAFRSGKMLSIRAEVVYEHDQLEMEMGLDERLRHVPAKGERGEPTQVYAIARLTGGAVVWTHMSRAEVDAIRARSKASGSGPWVTDYTEMTKKTAIRRLAKILPMATEADLAIDAEDRSHLDAGLYSQHEESPRVAAMKARARSAGAVVVDQAPADPADQDAQTSGDGDPYAKLDAVLKRMSAAQRRALDAAVGETLADQVDVMPRDLVERALGEAMAIVG